jgi:hypothetical protein
MIFPLLSPKNFRGIEAGNRPREIGRDIPGELEIQIAGAADAEERGEVAKVMAGVDRLVV